MPDLLVSGLVTADTSRIGGECLRRRLQKSALWRGTSGQLDFCLLSSALGVVENLR